MKRFKEFFSPVVGGNYDGYTFKEFFLSWQRLGLMSILIVGMLIVLFHINEFEYSMSAFWFLEIFLFSILCIVIYKGVLQHWSDMKNHTSR